MGRGISPFVLSMAGIVEKVLVSGTLNHQQMG